MTIPGVGRRPTRPGRAEGYTGSSLVCPAVRGVPGSGSLSFVGHSSEGAGRDPEEDRVGRGTSLLCCVKLGVGPAVTFGRNCIALMFVYYCGMT